MQFVLVSGQTIYFDEEDRHYLMCTSWLVSDIGYLRTSVKGKPTSFHRLILNFPTGSVDHINGNKLDNRKTNLRIADQTINMFNSKTKKHTSRYRGVCWSPTRKQWRATINKNKKQRTLGYFTNEQEAYQAYLLACNEVYGFLPYEVTK